MIHITPLSRLDAVLEATRARHLVSLLSVDSVFQRPAHLDPSCHLHIAMHDITEEMPGFTAPSCEHVKALLDFADRWDRTAPLVVHCYAGISRSTAAAYCMAIALRPERNEAELARELRRLSPSATPNIRIVTFADQLLGRNGRMVRAIRAIGRGVDAYEGEPFVLPFPTIAT